MMVWQFPPVSRGGAEMQCWKQARALAARGHHVTILTSWPYLHLPRTEAVAGVTIRRLGLFCPITRQIRGLHHWIRRRFSPPNALAPDPFSADGPRVASSTSRKRLRWMAPAEYLGYGSFLLEAAWWARRKSNHAQVVHVHESHWLAGFGHWMAEQMGAPVFCKEAFAEVLQGMGSRDVPGLKSWKVRRGDCVFIAIAPHVRLALEQAGIQPEKIVDIPNGVGLPQQTALPEQHADAVYAGNFTQGATYKAFDVLFKAWGQAVHHAPHMRLRMYGAGHQKRWQLFAEQEGCGNSVHFMGRTDNLPQELLSAGYLVLPSRSEGLSNVLLEAMACGIPAVVSDIPGNTRVVRNGVEGLVVPVGDVDALAAAMSQLAKDPQLRAKMGRNARARAAQEFAIEKVAAQLEAAYAARLADLKPTGSPHQMIQS